MEFDHVTFSGMEIVLDISIRIEKEDYIEIPSDSGVTFNVKPKMKALDIGEKARDAILSGKFDQVNKPFCPLKYLIQKI